MNEIFYTDVAGDLWQVLANTLVFQYGGSMSGEHNDGLLRTSYLSQMFNPETVRLFEKTKDIFDPLAILNPGKKVYGDKGFAWNHIDTK